MRLFNEFNQTLYITKYLLGSYRGILFIEYIVMRDD